MQEEEAGCERIPIRVACVKGSEVFLLFKAREMCWMNGLGKCMLGENLS